MARTSDRLDAIASRYAARTDIGELLIAAEQPSSSRRWCYGSTRRQYFVASITKLFTVALIQQLRHEGALRLDDRVADVLGADVMRGLNVCGGRDYGLLITINELLSHTSGIPDYFDQRLSSGALFSEEMRRNDRSWSFEEFLEMARQLPGHFPPSTDGRAHYSDTNYQLLGKIVETVCATSYERQIMDRIVRPLGLESTWLFTDRSVSRYNEIATVRHGRTALHIPKTQSSFFSDGGMVSTTADQLRFLRAFIEGDLFPTEMLHEMTSSWRPVFSRLDPLESGMGIVRFKLPRWLTPFGASTPPMIGHPGSFGSFLFYVPERRLYVAGTINQMIPRSLPYRLLTQLVQAFT